MGVKAQAEVMSQTKLHAEANWIEMPPLESLQDLDNYPEFVNRFSGNSQP
jgi:hypothetical protein